MKRKKEVALLLLTAVLAAAGCADGKTTGEKTTESGSAAAVSGSSVFDGELEENVTIRVLENDTAISKGYFEELITAFNEAYADRHQKTSSQDVAFILSRNPDRRFFLCRYCLPHAESARPVGGPFYLSRSWNRHERIVFPVFSKSSSCIFTGHGSIHDRSESAHGCAQSRHRLLSGSTRLRTDCAR